MALIRLNGKDVELPKGANLLQSCLDLGIEVPHYCYHPALTVAGNCRMCLVEVKGLPKLTTSCSTPVSELPPDKKIDGKYDMVVETENDNVKKARESVMEFMLINHPLDCPICDQAGECRLQEYSFLHGRATSRFVEEKVHKDKRVDLGPHVLLDEERCIKCTRCVRFSDEISRSHELGLIDRSHDAVIGTVAGRTLDNPYSINTVDICPVGALTNKEFRFVNRPWFVRSAKSVCTECSRGCSTEVDVLDGELVRVRPRHNPDVNGYWMCDPGRLVFDRMRAIKRKSHPMERRGDEMIPIDWDNALVSLKAEMQRFHYDFAAGFVMIVSGRCTAEEMLAARELSRTVFGGCDILVPDVREGEDDALLIRAEKRPNLAAARALGFTIAPANQDFPAMVKPYKGAFLFRENPAGEAKDDKARAAAAKALESLELLLVADIGFTETAAKAHLLFTVSSFDQMSGLYVNFQGRAQLLHPAAAPPADVAPVHEVARRIMVSFGETPVWQDGTSMLQCLLAEPAFAGLDVRGLYRFGAVVPSLAAEPAAAEQAG